MTSTGILRDIDEITYTSFEMTQNFDTKTSFKIQWLDTLIKMLKKKFDERDQITQTTKTHLRFAKVKCVNPL